MSRLVIKHAIKTHTYAIIPNGKANQCLKLHLSILIFIFFLFKKINNSIQHRFKSYRSSISITIIFRMRAFIFETIIFSTYIKMIIYILTIRTVVMETNIHFILVVLKSSVHSNCLGQVQLTFKLNVIGRFHLQ